MATLARPVPPGRSRLGLGRPAVAMECRRPIEAAARRADTLGEAREVPAMTTTVASGRGSQADARAAAAAAAEVERAAAWHRLQVRARTAEATRAVVSTLLAVTGLGFLVTALVALPGGTPGSTVIVVGAAGTAGTGTAAASMGPSVEAALVALVFLLGAWVAGRPISIVKAAKMTAKARKKAEKAATKRAAKQEKLQAKAAKALGSAK